MAERTLIRPTAFVDAPFGHDGKVARLAGGLIFFSAVELLRIEGNRGVSAELVPVAGLEERFDDDLAAQWAMLDRLCESPCSLATAPFASTSPRSWGS